MQEPAYGLGGREVEILADGRWVPALVWGYGAGSYDVQTLDEPIRSFKLQENRMRPTRRYDPQCMEGRMAMAYAHGTPAEALTAWSFYGTPA